MNKPTIFIRKKKYIVLTKYFYKVLLLLEIFNEFLKNLNYLPDYVIR